MIALENQIRRRPSLLAPAGWLLRMAAEDVDQQARSIAMNILASQQDVRAVGLAVRQLDEADPAARVLALNVLRQVADARLVPVVVPLLQDSDPRVVVSAGETLQYWTQKDFGFRLRSSLPRFDRIPVSLPSTTGTNAIGQAQQVFSAWWQNHQREFSSPPMGNQVALSSEITVPAPECEFQDLEGAAVQLSDFRGKTVLLHFWDRSDLSSLQSSLPSLQRIQSGLEGRLVVLGVSLDTTATARNHEHAHGDHHGHAAAPDIVGIREGIRHIRHQSSSSYPLLIDVSGSAARRFSVSELPTFVLIDQEGNVRRRFVGPRMLESWKIMVEELLTKSQVRVSGSPELGQFD